METKKLDENQPIPNLEDGPLMIGWIFCPPSLDFDIFAFADGTMEGDLSLGGVWTQAVEQTIYGLLEVRPEGWSKLDRIFSEAIGQTVSAWAAQPFRSSRKDSELPGLVVDPHQVLDVEEHPAIRALIDKKALDRIGKALMKCTGAGTAVCIVKDGQSEYFFPDSTRRQRFSGRIEWVRCFIDGGARRGKELKWQS